MPNRPRLIAWILPFAVALLPGAPPAWAVATLTGLVTDMSGQGLKEATFTLEREEDEQEGKKVTPVPVVTDGSGRFKVENLTPGTYKLTSGASGTHVTEWVTVRDGETRERWLSPSTDPENPGPGNFSVGVGGLIIRRSLDITKSTISNDNGTTVLTKTLDTSALNKANTYDLDTNVGFVQAGYGLPTLGAAVGGGYLSLDATVYGRIGAGTGSLDFKGADGSFSVTSGASPFYGGGLNLKVRHSASPVYAVFGVSGYYLDLRGLSTSEGIDPNARNVSVEGSQYGVEGSAVAGAKLGRLFPGALPPYLGKVNVQAGIVASFLWVDTTVRASLPGECRTVPGPPLGPFPDSPRGPDEVVCIGDSKASVKRDFGEQTAIGGRVALTFPILARGHGLLQADVSSNWWSLIAKLAFAFDP